MHFSHCIAYVCYKSDFPGIYKIVEDSAWVMRSRKSKDRQRKDKKKVQKVKGFMSFFISVLPLEIQVS